MATYPPLPKISGAAKHSKIHKVYSTVAVDVNSVKSARKYQSKGPNMLKRMIKNLVTWSMTENHRHQEDIAVPEETWRISATGIRFEVYRANGGTVIETRRNDRRTGDSIYELHVVAGDQDVGEEIGKIITMEALKS